MATSPPLVVVVVVGAPALLLLVESGALAELLGIEVALSLAVEDGVELVPSLETGIRRDECTRALPALPVLLFPVLTPFDVPELLGVDRSTSPPDVFVVVPRSELPFIALLGQLVSPFPVLPAVAELLPFALTVELPAVAFELPLMLLVAVMLLVPFVPFMLLIPVVLVVPFIPFVPLVLVVPGVPDTPEFAFAVLPEVVPGMDVLPVAVMPAVVVPDCPFIPTRYCAVAHGLVLAVVPVPFVPVPVVCAFAPAATIAPSATATPTI